MIQVYTHFLILLVCHDLGFYTVLFSRKVLILDYRGLSFKKLHFSTFLKNGPNHIFHFLRHYRGKRGFKRYIKNSLRCLFQKSQKSKHIFATTATLKITGQDPNGPKEILCCLQKGFLLHSSEELRRLGGVGIHPAVAINR